MMTKRKQWNIAEFFSGVMTVKKMLQATEEDAQKVFEEYCKMIDAGLLKEIQEEADSHLKEISKEVSMKPEGYPASIK